MSSSLKRKGYHAENIAASYYTQLGYQLLEKNRTLPSGEIDLIFEYQGSIVFVEVKSVDHTEDRTYRISPRKLQHLERSIESYCYHHAIDKEIRLDAVFVCGEEVVEHYENISTTN